MRDRGIMTMAIFGNVITSLSWFGVNMLGVGLHSYGFMDKAFWALSAFIASQLALMALRLDGRHYGDLYDYWGGLNDLRRGSVRVLHSLSFVDDPTRMLRAVRFEQRFGFQIEDRTLELISEAADLMRWEACRLFDAHEHPRPRARPGRGGRAPRAPGDGPAAGRRVAGCGRGLGAGGVAEHVGRRFGEILLEEETPRLLEPCLDRGNDVPAAIEAVFSGFMVQITWFMF